jgi:hypothetical protein
VSRTSLLALALLGCTPASDVAPRTQQAPPGTLVVDATPFWFGEQATITIANVPPGREAVLYGTVDQSAPPECPPVLGGVCLDIGGTRTLGRATADGAGVATINVQVPPSLPVPFAALQAGTFAGGGDTSNIYIGSFVDPFASDLDGDGISDGLELGFGTDPLSDDTDGDTLLDGDEFLAGTDPRLPDTDGDGLDDDEEPGFGTDPLDPDTDRDLLADGQEVAFGLDPTTVDTDGDTLADGDEVLFLNTDPRLADSDGGGTDDALEIYLRTDPRSPVDDAVACAAVDTDGDGIRDCEDAEECDGLDNDGDGAVDEGTVCPPALGDTGETGTVADTGDTAAPQPTGFRLDATPFWFGRPALLTVSGAPPGATVQLFATVQTGAPPDCPANLQGTCLDIGGTTPLGSGRADSTGVAIFPVDVPGFVPAAGAALQAATFFGGQGFVSNVHVGTFLDPNTNDFDGDGILDAVEFAFGTDATLPDTDGDGLLDGDEARGGTDPTAADTDGDGLDDGDELAEGTDPELPDTDGDGLVDGDEVDVGTDPLGFDTDDDGILDGEEYWLLNTDPLLADTDGGGTDDYLERYLGTDPLDGADDIGLCSLLDSDRDGIPDCTDTSDTGAVRFGTFRPVDSALLGIDTFDTDPFLDTADTSPLAFGYEADIEPILRTHCGACHFNGAASGGLDMEPGVAALVDVPSSAGMPYVTASDRNNSYLWRRKVNGTHLVVGGTGTVMPPPPALPVEGVELLLLQGWIDLGAAP